MSAGLLGIDYDRTGPYAKSGRMRSKRVAKREKILAVAAACARSRADSDRIRSAAGLAPVPDNFYREALAAKLAELRS